VEDDGGPEIFAAAMKECADTIKRTVGSMPGIVVSGQKGSSAIIEEEQEVSGYKILLWLVRPGGV
jgi:hypothetical protein